MTTISNLSPNTNIATKSRTKLVEKVVHIKLLMVAWVPVVGIIIVRSKVKCDRGVITDKAIGCGIISPYSNDTKRMPLVTGVRKDSQVTA